MKNPIVSWWSEWLRLCASNAGRRFDPHPGTKIPCVTQPKNKKQKLEKKKKKNN